MGYYRGLYGGVTPVQTELARTGDILGQGLAAAGQNALKKEQWGTQKALTEASLVRQAEMDKLQRPIYQKNAQEATLQMEQENQPLSVQSLFGDHWGITHALSTPRGGEPALYEKVGNLFGAKIDADEKSPTYGKYVKPDGTPVTFKDARTNAKSLQALILANTDPIQAASDMNARYTEKLAAIQAKDPELKSPEAQKVLNNLKSSSSWLDDPNQQLATLERQRKMLGSLEGPEFEKATARLDSQIAEIKKNVQHRQDIKEEQGFRAGESAKDRASREKEAELNREAGRQPKPREIGSTRTYEAGNEKITQEWDGFQWKTMGTSPITHALTEDKLPARIKAKLDSLKEEKKAIDKSLYGTETLDPATQKRYEDRKNSIDLEIDGILGEGKATPGPKQGKQVVRTGTDKKTGRKVNQYSDGSVEYADEQKAVEEPAKQPESLKEPVEVNPRGEQRTNIKYNEKSTEGRMMSLKDIYGKLTPDQRKKATQAESSGYKLTVKDGQLFANIYGKDVLIGPRK